MIRIYVIEMLRGSDVNISEEIEKILNDNLLPVQKVTAIDSGDKNEK